MSKNWHQQFTKLDGSKAQAAAQAFQFRLEDLQAKLAGERQRLDELQAQAPDREAQYEESLLGDDPTAAKMALIEFWESISDCEKRIAAIEATLQRDRQSPELSKLAGKLWDMTAKSRSALIELFPDALTELEQAQEAYLQVVGRVGGLGTKIARMEEIMNRAASPFLGESKYQTPTQLPPIFMAQDTILAAYDPNRTLSPSINPEALTRPPANANTALAVLRGE
jgi:hypothetical protein